MEKKQPLREVESAKTIVVEENQAGAGYEKDAIKLT